MALRSATSAHAERTNRRSLIRTRRVRRTLASLRWPLAGTALVVAGALGATSPLIDPERGTAVDASLALPAIYHVASPLFAVLDQLSLLTLRQHEALLLTVLVLLITWRAIAMRGVAFCRWRFGRDLRATAVVLGVVLAVYGGGLFVPRPMARLELHDADDIAVDFHSHTNESHDVRGSFSLGANRAWHMAAGFGAVYVTDHGAEAAERSAASIATVNPARAGDGIVMLPGLEVVDGGTHVIALAGAFSAEERDARTIENVRDRPRKLAVAEEPSTRVRASETRLPPALPPLRRSVLIQTLPAALSHIGTAGLERIGSALSAIELIDAAPRGLEQSARDRDSVLKIADRYDLAVVAASNNHGLGRTAAAWSVLHLPGWRDDSPAVLAQRIEERVLTERRRAVAVIARRGIALAAPTTLTLALTGPEVLWESVTTIGNWDRVSWLFWIWALPLTQMVMAYRRRLRRLRLTMADHSHPPRPPLGDTPATEAA